MELDLLKISKNDNKILQRINLENKIKASQLWKPPDDPTTIYDNTDSWFSTKKLYKEIKDNDFSIINVSKVTKCYMVNITPTQYQRKVIFMWFEICRIIYNMTIDYLRVAYRNRKLYPNDISKYPINFINVRTIIDNKIINNTYLSNLCNNFFIYKNTRNNAINDAIKAYTSAFSNMRNGNITGFRIRYKKKCNYSSICIEPQDYTDNTCNDVDNKKYKNGFRIKKLGNMKSDKPLNKNIIQSATRLCYNNKFNRFVIMVPIMDKEIITEVEERTICSLDPGMRTFQTVYSPDNIHEICSGNDLNKIKQDIKLINKGEFKRDKKGPNFEKYLTRLRKRLHNRIEDLHWKSANYLCKKYDTILIGKLSKGITSKEGKLRASTKDLYYALSHYTFRQRLISKGKEFGCKVIEVAENFTSMTCGNCGNRNRNLGSNKTFYCNKCNFRCDRDYNAARNILIFNTAINNTVTDVRRFA